MTTPLTPLTPAQEAQAQAQALKEGYLHRLIKGVDELDNVATGGNLGQSLSSRIGLDAAKGDPGAILLAHALGLFQPNHVVLSEAGDEAQAAKVVELEQESPDLPPVNSARIRAGASDASNTQ